ncbi:hypothetical protein BDW42DRAFT_135565 [Aspergillus taichungensis]|uniref:CENP-V/GFA domain-containing protein n=1 Tax=Aspergillus taichungensis TaxID=482145 RepID=A0A2J5HP36_9EURO|nr:hypothetical protein BDW42DRAFT_135565 [Aspergillus taichungensis]
MDALDPLHGSCLCGRNQYTINIPEDVTDHAQIYFDDSRDNRRLQGSPLTAWLRVPLSWYQSHTESFFPDETHSSIRRTYTPLHAPQTQRVFCGFCGSPLTHWSEDPREDAEFMSVTLGSLSGKDQRTLEDLDLLPETSDEEQEETGNIEVIPSSSTAANAITTSGRNEHGLTRTFRQGTVGGIPWFEEMIEGSRLGRLMKSRHGVGASDDRSTTFEWEISEWSTEGSGDAIQPAGKRKRGRTSFEGSSPQKR